MFNIPHRKQKPLKSLKKEIIYDAKDYNLGQNLTGKNVKIAIIDSGLPSHSYISNDYEKEGFIEGSKLYEDDFGHSSMVAGVLAANKQMRGFAPDSEYFFAKVVETHGSASFNAVISGILWAITKGVDIILLAFGTYTDHPILADTIKKAHEIGILVIAAGPVAKEDKNIFPASYDEALSVSTNTDKRRKKTYLDGEVIKIIMKEKIMTLFKNNQFIESSGSSMAAAVATGLCACIIEKIKKNKLKVTNKRVVEGLLTATYKES